MNRSKILYVSLSKAVWDHLKYVETLLNKDIEEGNILTAQIYAQTNLVYF
jgi:hypothetical protein